VTLKPLRPHPACPAPGGLAVLAGAAFAGSGGLTLTYCIAGAGALRIPPPALPAATDELWRHTCCEAFVAAVDRPEYLEFNLSPSGRWAAYRFTGYRQRDTAWLPPAVPAIAVRRDGDALELAATLPAALLPEDKALDFSLTVVAEELSGALSYWALSHPGASPDFHRRASFTLRLERP
jgi:hypothetical protein